MSQNGVFYIVQLQIIHLLNIQCNAMLMRGPSMIAEFLVIGNYCSVSSKGNSK